jgi:poly(3-hydroxybutyrate) depolymerase
MKSLLLLLFGIALFPNWSSALSAEITKDSFVSGGEKRSFYLFVPETVTASKPAPLIILLHGSGRNGRILVEKWKELATKEGIILAGPDARDASRWSMPEDGPDFLRDLVEALKAKNVRFNPRRVYLFGHSAGASFGIYMSLLESEYFAASAVHAGAIPRDDPYIAYAKRKIPITIFVGDRDPYFPLAAVRATRDALNARGFAAELKELAKHDHDYYGRAAEINRAAWAFLSKHELAEEPRYTQYGPGE